MDLLDRMNEQVVNYDLVFDIEPREGPVGAQVTVRRRGWSDRNYVVKTGGNTLQEALAEALDYVEGKG